jgi:hypothetical protein
VRPAERSSLDAVLAHRTELNLTTEQTEQLQAIDDAREHSVVELRGASGEHHGRGGARGMPTGNPSGDPASNARPPGMGGGGGRGGGGMGRGSGLGGLHGGARGAEETSATEQVQAKLDDADTQAFLKGEALLQEPQKEPARVIASKYREALFNYREAMKKLRASGELPDAPAAP